MSIKRASGILLSSIGYLIYPVTLFAATVYFFGFALWMHAPVVPVLQMIAVVALPLLGLGWLCTKAGSRLRRGGTPAVATPDRFATPDRIRLRRWLGAALGLAVIVACVMVGRTGYRIYQCQVGPPPGTPEETLRNGFKRMCEGDLARFDISFKSLASATRDLAFTPVDLTHTPFARLESLGARSEAINDVRSRLYRGFRMPDGHVLTLSEQDMSADGSRTWRRPEDEPERINGLPARLGVFEDEAGTAISHLSWVEGRRAYELWIDANVVRVPLRDQLFTLAASLPRSVPACPNEPPPKPSGFDAEGRPIKEPMPTSLTEAEMDAMFDRSKRPCR